MPHFEESRGWREFWWQELVDAGGRKVRFAMAKVMQLEKDVVTTIGWAKKEDNINKQEEYFR